ncbi:hypothetical protein MACJ_003700 [Theileria orientalis]|uniref:Uncharacterized protein n=1 Tax=Theileria orientalis TaxID=68886 RepID=A0A976SL75_THEOR|nr:hypothetical protein MACJ_003700 [Theileria orientalis]
MYEYKFKADAKCVELKHQNNKVWSRGDEATPVLDKEKEYPLKIIYHVEAKAISVLFRNTYLEYVSMDDEWILRVSKGNVKIWEDPRSTLVSNVDSSGQSILWDTLHYREQSEPEAKPDTGENSLENKSDKSQDKLKQEQQEHDKSSSSSSTPDPNKTKKPAKQDQQEPDKQQSKVSEPTDTSGKPGQSSVATSTPNPSKSKKERKGIELDIGSKKDTEEYNYKVNYSGTGIYSAKSDYAFNHVKDGCSKIWSTNKHDEFADFVDVYNVGNCAGNASLR